MRKTPYNLRSRLLLFTAFTVAGALAVGTTIARAQTSTGPVVVPGNGTTPDLNAYQIEKVKVLYQKLKLKEKDIPNAISHEDKTQIAAEGTLGSIQSVLRQTPSVNEYQSSPGQGVPVLTIRGVRLSELTETLDGTPMSDILEGGQGGFLANANSSPVTLGEIEATTIYPGVAPPADQGFGSGGGTIAYQTLTPEPKKSAELFGSYGSFNTSDAGFELNTGSLNGQPDGARALLRYDQGYTKGFIDDTNNRDGNMIFKVVKPYAGGLSNVSLTVIYNRADGYVNTAPVPTDLINSNSYSYNFSKSLTFERQDNTYLTAILHDETYINPSLILSGDLFEIHTTSDTLNYQNPNTITYNPAFPYQITFQIPYFQYLAFGQTEEANVGLGYNDSYYTYDPYNYAQAGCTPTNFACYANGEDAELLVDHENTVGFQTKANILLPYNSITVGGLMAKESAGGYTFVGNNPNVPQDVGVNAIGLGGGSQRSVYQMYIQDKIDVLNNKLHIQPGVTVASTYSSDISVNSFGYPPYKLQNFNVIAEPYIGVSYDLPQHVTAYASYGKGGYFAPLSLYSPNVTTAGTVTLTAPKPEIIHLYEAGLRYDTPRALINIDAFYQKITDADSFFTNYATSPTVTFNGNEGAEQFRGYELDSSFNITPALTFFGNASFVQANYLDNYFALDTPFEDQYGYVFKGDPLASVPNWLANFGLDYHLGNFGAHLTEEYTGQQFITYDFPPVLPSSLPNITANPSCVENSCLGLATVPDYPSKEKEALAGPVPFIKQAGFLISNLLLSYDLPLQNMPIQKLHFELNIQNLLGVKYYSHLYSSYAEIPDGKGGYEVTSPYNSAFTGPPRSFTIGVSAKF